MNFLSAANRRKNRTSIRVLEGVIEHYRFFRLDGGSRTHARLSLSFREFGQVSDLRKLKVAIAVGGPAALHLNAPALVQG